MPYICQECGAGFTKNSDLKNHMRTLCGKKLYLCQHWGGPISVTGVWKKILWKKAICGYILVKSKVAARIVKQYLHTEVTWSYTWELLAIVFYEYDLGVIAVFRCHGKGAWWQLLSSTHCTKTPTLFSIFSSLSILVCTKCSVFLPVRAALTLSRVRGTRSCSEMCQYESVGNWFVLDGRCWTCVGTKGSHKG